MDFSETLAHKYLVGLDLGKVVYEPDGNIPPDFSIGGHVGVEVRRLNQNFTASDGTSEGLEEVSIPLWQRMKRLLQSLGPSVDGECWYVAIDYGRPLPEWRLLEARIRRELTSFRLRPTRGRASVRVAQQFELEIFRSGTDHGSFFILGGSSDDDSGGWVMGEVERNLRLCIAEKEKKIAPYRRRYSDWWLVLPDYIDFSMDAEDREEFRSEIMPTIPHIFTRIVLLDPRDNGRIFEIG